MKCTKCFLHKSARRMVMGTGPRDAKIILIGEAPGREEDIRGIPFVGRAGDLLSHIIHKLGLHRDDFYITNVLKCKPPKNKLPSGKRLDECLEACDEHLASEIYMHRKNAKSVVLLGATALRAFTGDSLISKYIEQEVKPNIWCSYHPAFALRRPVKELSIYRTIYKACKRAKLKTEKGKEHWFDYETSR